MKLLTIDAPPAGHPGVLLGSGEILDLARLSTPLPASVRAILEAGPGTLELVRRLASRPEPQALYRADSVRLLAPIPNPQMVFSTGGAYRAHLEEMKVAGPQTPVGFIKCQASITGPDSPIVLPRQAPGMVDYEGEFSCVIGRTCYNVSPDEAMQCVAGYTIVNDVSARDWVADFLRPGSSPVEAMRATLLNLMGKQFPTFCPVGPVVVTADEIPDPHDLTLATRLNGEVMQHARTADLIHRLADTISYFSRWYRFVPGDIITTGSPQGVGYARNPQVFMKPGDVVEVEVSGIGILRNPVVAEA
jgi:acylpyruvate hydrolase